MKKIPMRSELAYVVGNVLIALGVAFMEKSDFGVSMIVAPAYILYRWLNPMWSAFTFGTAEYCLQAVLLILMCLVMHKFRVSYLLSFATAVIYGLILDGCMLLVANIPTTMVCRVIWYILGALLGPAGVCFMFRTYLSPEVYELLVKECSRHFHIDITKFKTWYDRGSCLVGVLMSFACFGLWQFVGVKWGTIICAVINGPIVGLISGLYEKCFTFSDALPWRPFFTGEEAIKKGE